MSARISSKLKDLVVGCTISYMDAWSTSIPCL